MTKETLRAAMSEDYLQHLDTVEAIIKMVDALPDNGAKVVACMEAMIYFQSKAMDQKDCAQMTRMAVATYPNYGKKPPTRTQALELISGELAKQENLPSC